MVGVRKALPPLSVHLRGANSVPDICGGPALSVQEHGAGWLQRSIPVIEPSVRLAADWRSFRAGDLTPWPLPWEGRGNGLG
jgi:hypothetical protein